MTKAHSNLCGLVRRQSNTEEEWSLSHKERRDNRIINEEESCAIRRENHDSRRPLTPLLSQVKHSQRQSHPKDHSNHRSNFPYSSKPLKSWPPEGYTLSQAIPPPMAYDLIVAGAPFFHGHKLPIVFGEKEYYHLFSTHSGNGAQNSDGRIDKILGAASLRLQGSGVPVYPWETLEQPSMAFIFGSMPGTVTLNHWVNMSSRLDKKKKAFVLDNKPREVTLSTIVERLIYFEKGAEGDDTGIDRQMLYKNLPRLSELIMGPQKTVESEIHHLIQVLSRRTWIDFSRKQNHIVAKFFANMKYADKGRHKLFFYQLLLALELEIRIQGYDEESKIELLRSLPEKLKWDLAIAKVWRSNIKIKSLQSTSRHNKVNFLLLNKRQQLKKLFEFAKNLKWPSLSSLEPFFFGSADEIDSYSLETVSYFTGVILPGPSLPFLLMNTLIDIDPASSGLDKITHFSSNTGLQYKGATYWNTSCVVGKVLAPTCREIGGWVGPARPAMGLDRSHVARIYQRKPKQRLQYEDVETIFERSLPLGPKSEMYPVGDYILLKPDNGFDSIVDTIRIEKLSLSPLSSIESESVRPRVFEASIQFAVNGKSWHLILKYDVTFVSSCSCKGGPHPIFFDYEHEVVRVDEIVNLDWTTQGGIVFDNNLKVSLGSPPDTDFPGKTANKYATAPSINGVSNVSITEYDEKVLVIEAYGAVENEVLARAWCAQWGLSALIADIQKICMGCAIRESFAACINVLILIDSATVANDDN